MQIYAFVQLSPFIKPNTGVLYNTIRAENRMVLGLFFTQR
jgi:hypothetical protein